MVRARKKPPDGRANNGGARQGQPGQQYANRADLRTQKIAVPKSAEYGQGEALRRSQQAVPMAALPPSGEGVPAAPSGPMAAAAAFQMPSFGAFDRPTERPDEPLTHGAPVGAGAGPEILPGMGGGPTGMAGLLRTIAGAVGSSDLDELASRAEALGQ